MTTTHTTETSITTGWSRRVEVTVADHGTYLLLEDMAPDDLRDGPQVVSASLEPGEARVVAEALLGTEGAGSAFTLSGLADLRARWANETQGYHPGGRLPRTPYVEQFAPKDDRHVVTGGKAPAWDDPYVRVLEQAAEINDLKAERDDALARASRAEDRLARLRDAYSDLMADTRSTATDPVYAVTEEEVDDVWVTVHTNATARETIREYRTDRRAVVPGETPERLRESIGFHLQSVVDLEAIARTMEPHDE